MSFIELKKGTTRLILLIGSFAFKFPNFLNGYKLFLCGLLANIQEVEFKNLDPLLCPIKFYLPAGFLVVMPRVIVLNTKLSEDIYNILVNKKNYTLPIENKASSFGYLIKSGRLVAIDYGS